MATIARSESSTTSVDALVRVAEALLEREVLEGAEVRRLIDGVPLTARWSPPKNSDDNKSQQVIRPDRAVRFAFPTFRKGTVRCRRERSSVSGLPV